MHGTHRRRLAQSTYRSTSTSSSSATTAAATRTPRSRPCLDSAHGTSPAATDRSSKKPPDPFRGNDRVCTRPISRHASLQGDQTGHFLRVLEVHGVRSPGRPDSRGSAPVGSSGAVRSRGGAPVRWIGTGGRGSESGPGGEAAAASGWWRRQRGGSPSTQRIAAVILRQYYLGCLAHASYLVADRVGGTAAVIDPQRDIEQYLADAEELGCTIGHVFLTHMHADFIAGHLELRDRVGATIHLGARGERRVRLHADGRRRRIAAGCGAARRCSRRPVIRRSRSRSSYSTPSMAMTARTRC